MSNFLNRTALLQKEPFKIERIDFENGDYVFVRQMNGRERDRFEQSLMKEKKDEDGNLKGVERSLEDFRAKLAVCVLCDETGKLIMQPEDAALLSQNISAVRLAKIVDTAQAINKITEHDKDALLKNSVAGETGNSISDSVSN